MKALGVAVVGLLAAAPLASTSVGASSTRPVTVFAPYRGAEAEAFTADLDAWAARRGIDVRYTGTGDLATGLQFRVTNADPPDIALVPQPGLVAELARDGKVLPLAPEVESTVRRNLGTAAQSLGVVDGVAVGFPYRVNVKGLVWYRPAQLADLGLEPPKTLAQLADLVEAIRDRDLTPWCFGVEAQRSTGWAATDWIENLVLRNWGPDVYADWVTGAVPFADPRIASTFEEFRQLVLAPGHVSGGVARAIATPVADASAPMFADPPGCVLYQQASFAVGWFPHGTTVGRDGTLDFFTLPPRDAGPTPLVVGTDVVVAFDQRSEVDAVMQYLATPGAARTWAGRGGFISPQRRLSLQAYGNPADRAIVDQLVRTEELALDGSDAMPPVIGTDLFWDRITKWMADAITYDELAADLDAARQ